MSARVVHVSPGEEVHLVAGALQSLSKTDIGPVPFIPAGAVDVFAGDGV
jgi:hypothetical protein